MSFFIRYVALWIVLTGGAIAQAGESVPLYTYHTHAPFILDESTGLTYDLASYLEARSGGRFKFPVRSMSRPHLNSELETASVGVVPWVNPIWFNDKSRTKYLWTESVLMADANAIVSHKEMPIDYRGPETLKGLIFGGLQGHHYVGIDELVKNGKIRRIDADNHGTNFFKLAKRRIDATLTPDSGARYLIRKQGLVESLYISSTPHSTFNRRFMVLNKRSDIATYLEKMLAAMPDDPQWQAIMDQYQ